MLTFRCFQIFIEIASICWCFCELSYYCQYFIEHGKNENVFLIFNPYIVIFRLKYFNFKE